MSSKIVRMVMATGAAAAMAVAVGVSATPASAASCYASGGNLYCGNNYDAPVYRSPNFGVDGHPTPVVDRLKSTFSYFKCWRNGEAHGGGNSVWYLTYGDVNGAWGYVPANTVHTPVDPFPGVNAC